MSVDWDQRLGVWWIAEDHPDVMAVVESPTGPLTYAELTGRAHQLVHALRSHGVNAGDGIAVILGNGVEIIVCSLACSEAGWAFTPLNTYLTSAEVAVILEHSGVRVLVVGGRFAASFQGAAAETAERLGVLVVSVGDQAIAGVASIDNVVAGHPTTPPDHRTCGSLFPYTSGTTGKPKGIKRQGPAGDPSAAAHGAAMFGRAFDFRPFDGPHLVTTGMYHGGSHSYYMGALNVGHGLVIHDKFDPLRTLADIERFRVRSAYMVPTQFHRLLQLPPDVRARYDISSLHSVVHSAAPCPKDVKQQMMDWWGPVIWETYGGMEGAATIAKPKWWIRKPGTVGRAIRGMTITILDSEGNVLGPNEVGGIYLDNGVGFSYHGDEEGTKSAFKDSRFTLGDVGYLDEDGYLFIKDRMKDMIITGGVNVYPAEIEALLLGHPAVGDVGVIGIPDADWGEQIKAVVQVKDGVEPSDELGRELIAFCQQHLAAYKCPRSVDFRDDMPRTEAGKLYKRQIRDEYWAASGRSL
jgi:long-chain acyl-CoA synthetase